MEDLKQILKDKLDKQTTDGKQKREQRGPRTKHQFLAMDIAESFGKEKNRKDIAVLMNICKKYPDTYLRQIWGAVKEKNISNKMPYFLAIIKNKNQQEEEARFKNLKIIFIGTSEFSVPALEKLKNNHLNILAVITQPDKPVGRKKIITASPVKIVANKYRLPVLQPNKISEIEKDLIDLKPDLAIMISYGQIIPQAIINIPKYGTLNIHPSILPKYRGSSPIQNAILNGEKQTGVTIMVVDQKMDHGPIIKSEKTKVDNKNYLELHNELAHTGASLLLKIIPDYINGKIKAKEQNDDKATFTKILNRDDGKIDWSKKAIEIERQVRAYYPWPGTWCYTEDNKKVKIIKVTIKDEKKKNKNYGEIIKTVDGEMEILCSQGSLIVETIQLEGKNEINGSDFIRGNINIKKLL